MIESSHKNRILLLAKKNSRFDLDELKREDTNFVKLPQLTSTEVELPTYSHSTSSIDIYFNTYRIEINENSSQELITKIFRGIKNA